MLTRAGLVLFFGAVLALQGAGMTLSGEPTLPPLPPVSPPLIPPSPVQAVPAGKESAVAVISGGIQRVVIDLAPSYYTPIIVQKGIPVEWTIRAQKGKLTGCNRALVIPDLGIEKKLQLGENLITFTPKASGTIGFTCWMGMISSTIQVVDKLPSKQGKY